MAKHPLDPPAPNSQKGAGCLLLFALPFAAVGVFVTGWIVRDLWTWRAVQSWVETPATLVSSELESHDDDGKTFRVLATYTYTFNGQAFRSERVALHTGRDNIGSYHRDRARELEQVRRRGGQTICYVNPDHPAEAMLFRDLRPGFVAFKLAFALVFGGIGFGLIGGGWFGLAGQRRRDVLQRAAPEHPWKWRDDWSAGRIRSSTGQFAVAVGLLAAFWNVICWPVVIVAAASGDARPGVLAGLIVFPAIGLCLAAWAGYLALRRHKWGGAELEMAGVPGVLGGPLAGIVRIPGRVEPLAGFRVQLACIKTEATSRGGESTRETRTVWEAEQTVDRDLSTHDGALTLIPIKFLVPYDLPPSGDDVRWLLTVRAATGGVDFRADFEAPVFHTDASSPEASAAAIDEAEPPPADFATLARRLGATVEEELPDRRAVRFPAARNRGMAGFVGSFAIVWIGICIALFYSSAPRLFPWVFSAFGAIIAWMAVRACLVATRLEYDRRAVAYSHRVLGLGRRREIPRDSVATVEADKSGTEYGGRAYHQVELRTHDGDRHVLASDIARRQDAQQLAADVRSVLALAESRSELRSSRMPLDAELPGEFRTQ